jgi:SAM-dependent methyltransferase
MSIFCHLCGSSDINEIAGSIGFGRVTSDCKPWRSGGRLACCSLCQTVQAVITSEWRAEAEQIYKTYTVYHQGGGAEQAVFNSVGSSETRSGRIVSQLVKSLDCPECGHLLDIGCGNGRFLTEFGSSFPGWKLSGVEVDAKHSKELQGIPGFQRFYSGGLDQIEERYDLISLVHTLEHIVGPLDFLKTVSGLLKPGGVVFIQVPFYRKNPFELMTADHASHFDKLSLPSLLQQSGLNPVLLSSEWVGKEISALATSHESDREGCAIPINEEGMDLTESLKWLGELLEKARDVQARSRSFGIFGSSIAATWIATNLPCRPDFFVDEDPSRANRTHLDRPIIHPSKVEFDADIFVALQPETTKAILSRHSGMSPGVWSAFTSSQKLDLRN